MSGYNKPKLIERLIKGAATVRMSNTGNHLTACFQPFRKAFRCMVLLLGILFLASLTSIEVSAQVPDFTDSSIISSIRESLSLTKEEKQWIKDHPTLQVAGPRAFPPFHFYSEESGADGISADYLKLIASVLDIELAYHSDLPWPDVLEKTKNGEIDVIACLAKTPERQAYLNFSHPYLSFPLVIITRTEAPFIGGINDLDGIRVACVEKTFACKPLAGDINSSLTYVDTPLDGLKAVAYGKVDAYIENLASVSYQIQKQGLYNLKVAAPTDYENYDLYMAGRADLTGWIPLLNKTLEAIPRELHQEIRNKWLGIKFEHGLQPSQTIKSFIIIIGIALIAILLTLFWNKRLQKEIAEKRQAEKALQQSQRLFATVFAHSPASFALVSLPDEVYLDVNKAFTELIGYDRQEILGKTPYDVDFWEDPEKRRRLIETVKSEGLIYNYEFDFRHKSGTRKTGLLSGVRISLEEGPCLLLVTMDITELKKSESQLREAQERYSALFDRSLNPVFIYDFEGNFLDANQAALDLTGYDKEEIRMLRFSDIVYQEKPSPEKNAQSKPEDELFGCGFQKEITEYRLKCKDGNDIWIEATGSLIMKDDKPYAIQGVARNITEMKNAEDEQKRLISELQYALDNIKKLSGMLPICANCKKIRDDSGYWRQIETFIEDHSDALFSHGICPDCANELYGNQSWYKKKKSREE